MKKVLMVCLLVFLAAVPVFSADNYLGIVTGPYFYLGKIIVDESTYLSYLDYNTIDYSVGIKGANYFTDNIGIGYGLDIIFPLATNGYVSTDIFLSQYNLREVRPGFAFDVYASLQGKYDFDEALALEVGIGAAYQYGSKTQTPDGTSINCKFKLSTVSVFADVGINYTIIDNFLVKAGLKIATPVSMRYKYSISSVTNIEEALKMKLSGIFLIPYIGAAIAY